MTDERIPNVMKKQIPYLTALLWMIVVAVLAFFDGLNWSAQRKMSSYLDGCIEGDQMYLVENIKGEGILYVMDSKGTIKEVSLASSVKANSLFVKIDYKEGLYALLRQQGNPDTYYIAQYDDQGNYIACTSAFTMAEKGIVTGFRVETNRCYLTMVQEGRMSAAAYLIDKQELGNTEESKEPTVLKIFQLAYTEDGRFITEARYEKGKFLLRLDDGNGMESFVASEKLQSAFWYRSLSVGQLIKVRHSQMFFYVGLLLFGYAALVFFLTILRNKSHTVYTIAIVEVALFAITLAGAVKVPRIQEKAKEEEAGRFGYYYVQALAKEIGEPERFHPQEKEFYQSEGYDTIREKLQRFVELEGISKVFTDICLVQSKDHKILVSVNGYNGQHFEEVYAIGTGELIQDLAEGGQKGNLLISIGGEAHQVIGVAASEELFPEYVMMGITKREELGGISNREQITPILYAIIVFLLGSAVSIWLLVLQGRELKHLALAMQMLASGQTEIKKQPAHGKDIDFMWNSLMETRKTISRMNYTKYQIFESCYRFAPKNIEKILGKDSITEVNSGDMVLLHGTMAIISSVQIEESACALSKQIGAFVSLMEAQQEKYGGFFVSGHCGLDVLKVLFLEESRNSVEFAISLMQSFLEKEFYGTKRAGIFLHYSQYRYGVAGTKKHSLPYLLSKEMEEMERYARWFQSLHLSLVITESVKNREYIDGPIRYIGYLLIENSQERIRVYEVLDACALREGKQKAMSDPKFQKGLSLFYQHDFYLARSTFNEVLRENPEDSMAKWYLFTCEKYLNETHRSGDICRLCIESTLSEEER